MPLTNAAPTLNRANGQPKNVALTNIESTPVCGVLIKNPTAAPLDAPSFRNPSAAGITPHEHNGNGTPTATALNTPDHNPPPRCRRTNPTGKSTCNKPAIAIPSSNHGPSSSNICHISYR